MHELRAYLAAQAATTGLIIGGMPEQGGVRRSKRRYWNWLLAVPLLLLVYPGMYARTTPELFGFPFFYWYQLVVVVATALLTGMVYWLTHSDANERTEDR